MVGLRLFAVNVGISVKLDLEEIVVLKGVRLQLDFKRKKDQYRATLAIKSLLLVLQAIKQLLLAWQLFPLLVSWVMIIVNMLEES